MYYLNNTPNFLMNAWSQNFRRTYTYNNISLGVGKRAGLPALATNRASPSRFLHKPNKLVRPLPADLAGQTGRSAGLLLKESPF